MPSEDGYKERKEKKKSRISGVFRSSPLSKTNTWPLTGRRVSRINNGSRRLAQSFGKADVVKTCRVCGVFAAGTTVCARPWCTLCAYPCRDVHDSQTGQREKWRGREAELCLHDSAILSSFFFFFFFLDSVNHFVSFKHTTTTANQEDLDWWFGI